MVLGGTRRRELDLTPMSEDGSLFSSPSTPNTPSEHSRDEQSVRSVSEPAAHAERAKKKD